MIKRIYKALYRRTIRKVFGERAVKTPHPIGHYYSPVVNPKTLGGRENEIWCKKPKIAGIDFNDNYHVKVLSDYFPKYISQYKYVEKQQETKSNAEFYTQNSQFSWLDSRTLFVLLNQWKPKTMIEVGSGFSSLLTADVNYNLLGGSIHFTCIEPFPREFLKKKIPGLSNVIAEKVENVDKEIFKTLQSGDVLFMDSSHVAKTGSDVNFLFFEIFPLLNKGVKIHIHDIFLPHEYEKAWVLEENRSWNEQYLLRALLMNSDTFKVLFGCYNAHYKYPELVTKALNQNPDRRFSGSSIWIEKVK